MQTFSSKLYFQLSILRHKRGEGVVKQCSGFAQLLILWILHSLLSAAAGPFFTVSQKSFFSADFPPKISSAWFAGLVSTVGGRKMGHWLGPAAFCPNCP